MWALEFKKAFVPSEMKKNSFKHFFEWEFKIKANS